MEKRAGAVTFKGNPCTLVGPQLKPGDKAPDFECVMAPLTVVKQSDVLGKACLFSVVPSLDTGVCSAQTKRFEESIAALKDTVSCYTVSLDLPFAQGRFCSAENIANVKAISDVRNHSFGQGYGVLIEGLPIPLLTRAVFVVNPAGQITYTEYVPEVTNHPNYDAALQALKAAAA
jgi:thioredoxin-dependent peroxiredoxin